jgi:hypothetical protein
MKMKMESRLYRLWLDSHILGEWKEINEIAALEIRALLAEHQDSANVIRFGGYARTSHGLKPQFSLMGQEEIETYLADMELGDDD